MEIKHLLILSMITVFSASMVCCAKQLTKEEQDYYYNLKNCRLYSGDVFTIHGFEGDKCKVTMTIPVPAKSNMKSFKYTYKYPRNVLYSMVNDALKLNETDFRAKWEPKEEEYCTEIRYGDEIIHQS